MTVRSGNHLLDSLPEDEFEFLTNSSSRKTYESGEVIYHSGDRFTHAYFPVSGMISQLVHTEAGHSAEIALVGRAEAFAMEPWLLESRAMADSNMQVPGELISVPSELIFDSCASLPTLDRALRRQAAVTLATMGQTLACNAVHEVRPRLARWLLAVQDRVEDSELKITHEFLATMLATGRPTVSISANAIRDSGAITYTRGSIRVIDRELLRKESCECGDIAHKLYARLNQS